MNNPLNTRQLAVAEMKSSISSDLWQQNHEFVEQLHAKIRQHAVSIHPAIAALNTHSFNKSEIQAVHLDYRHAIVQIFTDALLMAQYQCKQLEPRLTSGEKMFPRFLLTLNILDEFGFQSGSNEQGEYIGTPHNAHYPLFESVLSDLDITEADRKSYIPSSMASRLRECLERSYTDLDAVVALLGVAEEIVVLFSAPLRRNVSSLGVDVSSGYYWFHGTSDDTDSQANDDTHASDLRHVLTQALTPDKYAQIEAVCLEYCDIWLEFWDHQMERLLHRRIQAEKRELIVTHS